MRSRLYIENQKEYAKMEGGPKVIQMKIEFLKRFSSNFHTGKTCRALGITRNRVNLWRFKDPVFKTLADNLVEEDIDTCEANIHKALKDGDKEAVKCWEQIKYFLEHKALHRGWGEPETNVNVSGGVKLQIIRKIINEKPKNESQDDRPKDESIVTTPSKDA